jgi:hypothetical protein
VEPMKHLNASLPELEEPPIKTGPVEPADPRRSEPDREDPERAQPEKVGPERLEREEPERPERVEPMPSETSGSRESSAERPEERSWWRRMVRGQGMSQTDRILIAVGVLCAVIWVMFALPYEARLTLGGVVLGGGILAGLLSLAWRWWREVQEVRLLQAFWHEADKTHEPMIATVPAYKAVAGAKLQDPFPVLDRLQRKRYIIPYHNLDTDEIDPDYFNITPEGRARALAARPWWRFWS